MKVLILGGYGVFGGRLAELLADLDIALLIAGRSLAKVEAFCRGYEGIARVMPVALDRADIAAGLAEWAPDLVVDASGPFQVYGRTPYAVVEACIAAGVPYMDLADAADFVFGIARFDDAARAAGVFVLSGVSSFPVLTAAVLREMARDMEITSVTGGIAPSPHAGIGLNVMRAVVSYAGGPVRLLRGGEIVEAVGLAESLRYTIAVPGRVPLRNTRFSLVDVPDLQVLPGEHDGLLDIWMGAGPVPEVLHRALNVLAKARAALRLPNLSPLAPFFYRVLNLMKFGEHRGGMFVEAKGPSGVRSWHLLAEGDDGPYIPSMAVEAILRKVHAGARPEDGARAAVRVLDLADYDALFARRSIYTGFRSEVEGPLYAQVLGDAFEGLPARVRALHTLEGVQVWKGKAEVKRGRNPMARLIGWVMGLPAAADDVAVEVTLTPGADGERWQRNFGGQTFESFQSLGVGRNAHLLMERFGVVTVALAVVVKGERLYLEPRRWSVMGIPLPTALLPSGDSFETEADGRFRFDVVIGAPVVGLIAAYRGWLEPLDTP